MVADGATKQKDIFAHERGGRTNKGSGPDQAFTFEEFLREMQRSRKQAFSIQPPSETRSVDQVAEELRQAGFYGNLAPCEINRFTSSGRGD